MLHYSTDFIVFFLMFFLMVYCYTIVYGCNYVELVSGINLHHNNQIITLLLNHEWRHNKIYDSDFSKNGKKAYESMTFNVHHTTAQHAFYTYTKVTVTTCKGAPYVCEYRNFLLSALLSSPSSPLVSPLSFLSSLPPLSYPCSPF